MDDMNNTDDEDETKHLICYSEYFWKEVRIILIMIMMIQMMMIVMTMMLRFDVLLRMEGSENGGSA